jgi:ribosomal protein S18 acetylase RimI-like enzyme
MPTPPRLHLLTARDGRTFAVFRLAAGDQAALAAFNAQLSPQTRHLFLPHRYDAATLDLVVERSQSGEDAVFAAWDGPEIVGYFFLWYARRPVPLLGIGFADRVQGLGLGRQAMALLLDDARESGRDGLELTTDLKNDRAYALYESCGFRFLRNVDNVTGDGSIRVERAMFLPLRPDARPMTEPHQPPV